MYSHNVPFRLDDYLNQVYYPIEAPEYAMPKSIAFTSGELDPIFVPDKNAKVLTRASIAMMIDFCDRVIPFKILYADDIIEINGFLHRYIEQLARFGDIEEAALYLAKAKAFATRLNRSIIILSKTNKDAQKILSIDSLIEIFKTKAVEPTGASA
jgi:hypothetical protein